MKVLLINNCHYYRGGAETAYFGIGEMLENKGHEVVYLSFYDEQNIQTKGKGYFVKKRGGFSAVADYFSNNNAAREIDLLIKRERPDIAHVHLIWGGLTAAILPVLHKNNIPVVHTAHDYRMVCPAYLLRDSKGRLCELCNNGHYYQCVKHRCSKGSLLRSILMTIEMYYRNKKWHPTSVFDGFIFVSNFSQNKHIQLDNRFEKSNSIVLYNCPGADVHKSYNISKDTFNSYYLYYGRLSEEKGIYTLIKAFEKQPQLVLYIVGTGPLETSLKDYCSSRSLSNVHFLGLKKGSELYNLVSASKYVCVPSECYENNPMTIVEAYTLGVPVIGASLGGISEIVNDSYNGYSFDSGSIDSLISALNKAKEISKEDYNLLRQNSFNCGKTLFGRDAYYEKIISFYNSVIKNYNLKNGKE